MFTVFIYLALALGPAHAVGSSCESYLDRDISFDEFFPSDQDDPGFAALFLGATEDYIHVLSKLRSGLDFREPRESFEVLAYEPGQNSKLADQLERALEDQVPAVRNVMVNVRGLREIFPGFPHDVVTEHELPLRLLPAEWQRELLERLRKGPPPFTTPEMIERLIALSDHTEFRLKPRDTGVARDPFDPWARLRDLNPRRGTGWLLDGVIRHYFPGDRRKIDPVELRRVLNAHVTFWIADGLSEKRSLH